MTERRFEGIGVTPLSGVGNVVWYAPDADLDDPPDPSEVDADAETARFEEARDAAREELERERERTAERVGEDEAAVFDAHVQFLDDPQITDGVEEQIAEGLPAEHAVQRTFDRFVEQFEGMEGRMAERADDLRDVRDRLVRVLSGGERVNLAELEKGSVVFAERLTPSDTAQLDPERVAGFVTVTGGRTSHAAIFARSLALPAVVGVGEELNEVEDGAEVVVDGTDGEVIVDPAEETRKAAAEEEEAEIRSEPVATADGVEIEVAGNVGTAADLGPAADRGADGIGLFRTEFLFLDRQSPPDEEEQYETYVDALETFSDGRVVVRTLDVGGDKPIDYLDLPDEENPFLGERGIRRSLGPDSDLFETQLRALLRAAASDAGGDLAVMLPLVSTVEEVTAARERLELFADDLEREGIDYALPEFGVMVETPAAAFMAEDLTSQVDFFSIGTNDLAQYVMAAERGNERVAELGDYTQPAVLRAIRATVEAAEGTDVWVGMCGEMAGDPDLTELLLGLGLDELSMSAVTVPQVKQAVTETDTGDARKLAEKALSAGTKDEVRRVLTENTKS
ncbi:phosphoenolpyruvate--protein phosphotransferase [Halogeometricum luteum]|uniref:Phosphoenolpyruvate-protein phosphotransferase n=1 Tax=Halogeometricum luteum TaxID=2950537 RepID=A0ABU2FW83_9EURY|nr:phosphoenolpyruvate--protein phosphotransferase [Halogeometricum sp. S3BR5-2]MDS0292800.1 phosphoenolpyruvate--protein phosphotransferase [Halogeometricum sp. S3BR5-2]